MTTPHPDNPEAESAPISQPRSANDQAPAPAMPSQAQASAPPSGQAPAATPSAEAQAEQQPPQDPRRGHLKIYLGYASHTGKTWRLLEEARRRRSRGQDVVVGWVRSKDQPALAQFLADLEVVPPRREGLDLTGILKRKPQVCFIDELAHRNPPGSRHKHRWQDVRDLLEAGIDVVTAINIQYVADERGFIEKVLGVSPEITVPDKVIRSADEVVVVDATAEVVLGRSQQAGTNAVSERTLLALRERALLYAADNAEQEVQDYRLEHRIEETWETQERILVCLTANSRAPHLIERARKVATRWNADLWALYVTPDEDWSNLSVNDAEKVRGFLGLARSRGACTKVVVDTDPARGILGFAHEHGITQICLGHAAAYPYRGALSGTVAGRIIHGASGMDVHLISDEGAPLRQATGVASDSSSLPFLARLLSAAPRPESRGHLRVYLSYAPGSGKSWRMLQDGSFLKGQGQDVVVGFCDAHGRPDLAEVLRNFETIPPRPGSDAAPEGLDVAGVVARRPQICLVDGLAAPGADGRTRWQEVEALRDQDIHVFATVDVSEVEGLKDAVERIAGLQVSSTVPDWLLDEADELVFVDVATKALLNRVRRGAVFPGSEVPEGMRSLFTEGSLSALRELAIRLTAERVQDQLAALDPVPPDPEAAEVLLVAVDHKPSSARAIRRARRLSERMGASCYAIHVAPDEDWTGIAEEARAAAEAHLELARTLHLEARVLHGSHVSRTLVDFAVRHRVTRMLMGRSHKTGWREFFQRSLVEQVVRQCPWLDLIVVSERT